MLILILTILAGGTQAGYLYQKPTIPFELPARERVNVLNQKTANEITFQSHGSAVSYSVPFEDYHYLKHHKAEYHNSPYNDPHATHDSTVLQKIVQQSKNAYAKPNEVIRQPVLIPNQNVNNEDNIAIVQNVIQQSENVFAKPNVVLREPELISNQNVHNKGNVAIVQNVIQQSENSLVKPDVVPSEPILSSNQNINNEDNVVIVHNLIRELENAFAKPDIVPREPVSIPNQNVNTEDNVAIVQNVIQELESGFAKPDEVPSDPTLISNQNINHDGNVAIVQNVIQQSESSFATNAPINNQLLNFPDNRAIIQNTVQSEATYFQPDVRDNVEPIVTKDIYFHVPPPDIEEIPVYRPPVPPKKIYKIIFIKVPNQESANTIQLRQAFYNRIAPVEDKTLIYVLVKRPEPVQVLPLPPKPVPSEHEVFFVNYRAQKISAPLPEHGNLLQENTDLNVGPILQPGLVNGKR
ncbi:unnamed protein product [Parnassius apollo]|uniref:(apollo) hypothetical protein n=1 Tax=Parnassius apollo TaxID=110799 RepID=A0A8S3WZL6_PARAO|nr:unnamed protein product [Parnassius apollo]